MGINGIKMDTRDYPFHWWGRRSQGLAEVHQNGDPDHQWKGYYITIYTVDFGQTRPPHSRLHRSLRTSSNSSISTIPTYQSSTNNRFRRSPFRSPCSKHPTEGARGSESRIVEDAGGESPQILNVGQMEAVTRELKERVDTGAE